MEGTVSTLEEISRLDALYESDDEELSSARSEAVETLKYTRALTFAEDQINAGYPLSASMIRQTHQKLLSFGRGAQKRPGQYKVEQNYIVDRRQRSVIFVPIAPLDLPAGVDAMLSYMVADVEDVLIKIAVSHLEFEALHPFDDGNGRIGRMLITLGLWQQGILSAPRFYISAYFEQHKAEYVELMREVSATGDWNNWIAFFLEALAVQAESNIAIASSIFSLYEKLRSELPAVLKSAYTVQVLDYMFSKPIFTIPRMVRDTGIPIGAASKLPAKLLAHGVISCSEEGSGRRPSIYAFEQLFDLIN